MNIRKNYNHTLNACYLGYITQAIVNNFAPLLFLTFQSTYEISLDKIALLVSFNFGVQLIVDLLAAKYVDKIGYRNSVVAAHIFGAVGLVGLAVFPSDCRILSDRAKGCCDESSAFFLLLGACRRDSDLDCIFCHCGD